MCMVMPSQGLLCVQTAHLCVVSGAQASSLPARIEERCIRTFLFIVVEWNDGFGRVKIKVEFDLGGNRWNWSL